jgi:SAM-dependent methyltransferase
MSRDLMHSAEIKDLVREAYRAIDESTEAVARKLYSAEELAQVPQSAIDRALGVANHLRFAAIQPGQTILDVGCGGGIDTILAARRTGASGRVIALDFLPEMLRRTEGAAEEAGLENVETVEGEMEAIPLPDASVDQIISNGVINLSPRKARVMAALSRRPDPADEEADSAREAGRRGGFSRDQRVLPGLLTTDQGLEAHRQLLRSPKRVPSPTPPHSNELNFSVRKPGFESR